jgi:hypothetical protein
MLVVLTHPRRVFGDSRLRLASQDLVSIYGIFFVPVVQVGLGCDF